MQVAKRLGYTSDKINSDLVDCISPEAKDKKVRLLQAGAGLESIKEEHADVVESIVLQQTPAVRRSGAGDLAMNGNDSHSFTTPHKHRQAALAEGTVARLRNLKERVINYEVGPLNKHILQLEMAERKRAEAAAAVSEVADEFLSGKKKEED